MTALLEVPCVDRPGTLSAILAHSKRLEVDANLIHTPPGNPEPTLEDVEQSGLLGSVDRHGLLVELILYPHPALPGHYFAADGNHRARVLKHLGRKARGVLLEQAPSEDDLDTLRVALASTCKKVDKGLIGLSMFTWWKRVVGRTERDVAEHFGKSPSYVNKLLAPFKNGIPELVEALLARKIAPTAAPFVASLPHDQQRVTLPRVLGKKRAAVMGICDTIKPKRGKNGGRPCKVSIGGAVLTIRDAAPERVQEKLRAVRDRISEALKQVEKDPRLAPAIAQLLAG